MRARFGPTRGVSRDLSPHSQMDRSQPAGPLMETFVLMELARQLTWSTERARLYQYRTKDKVEVHAVLETPDGRVVGVEVKAGATVRAEDLAGLRHLAQRLGLPWVQY
ncbi:MAG TPA: DUF4143 domain-containing protein [Kineosporiaceae bacterium]|nr:DUF4143 domain-containing protein [Kineosporiaceae bacterium]